VHSPVFENAISKIQRGQEREPSVAEADSVKTF
jgi:hypothetical protein